MNSRSSTTARSIGRGRRLTLFSCHVSRGLAARILSTTGIVLLAIEAIFLAESFPSVFNLGSDAHASLAAIGLMLIFQIPVIFDVALAVALFVAAYLVFLNARETRELVALAGAGVGPGRILGILFMIGACGQVLSLVSSGAIEPVARYAQRTILFQQRVHALRLQAAAGSFYYFPDHVVLVGPRKAGGSGNRIFMRERIGATDRIITSDSADLIGPDASGRLSLDLSDFLSFDFDRSHPATEVGRAACAPCTSSSDVAPNTIMRVRSVSQPLHLDQLLYFQPRGSFPNEWTLSELMGLMSPAAPGAAQGRLLCSIAARSLFCLLAPEIALLALIFTTPRTRSLVLPVGCLAFAGADFLSSGVLAAFVSEAGVDPILWAMGATAAATAMIACFMARRHEGSIFRPSLARA